MDMYSKYKSKFGYQIGNNQIDNYGVDHSGFSLQDELAYQFAREEKENKLLEQLKSRGITENYPQYTSDFWGNNANNNYGFGTTDIAANIENMQNAIKQGALRMQTNRLNSINQNPNYISDKDLFQRMWKNIQEFERVKMHPYLDSKGYITTGAGTNIDNLNDFMKVNFMINGIPATDSQKLIAYHKLRDLSKEKDATGNYINRNRTADTFLDKTNLRISNQDAYDMAQNHMTNDLAHVRSEFSDYDTFPNPLKEVLLDIQYNVKGGLNKQNWPKLYEAIANRDVSGIANNVHRKDIGQDRNDWAERMARSIRF